MLNFTPGKQKILRASYPTATAQSGVLHCQLLHIIGNFQSTSSSDLFKLTFAHLYALDSGTTGRDEPVAPCRWPILSTFTSEVAVQDPCEPR